MQYVNMLSLWQWAMLAAVPPAILALYFLKLKREPLEVPSTYLWTRSIEDGSVGVEQHPEETGGKVDPGKEEQHRIPAS